MNANNFSVDVSDTRPTVSGVPGHGSIELEDLIDAIGVERLRLTRAHAVAQTAAQVLHEMFLLERRPTDKSNQPDIGFVLDAVAEMLEHSIGGLDRITADAL